MNDNMEREFDEKFKAFLIIAAPSTYEDIDYAFKSFIRVQISSAFMDGHRKGVNEGECNYG
jgi:hypothetical protein